MSLAEWFLRHRNVFSISAREVAAKPGDEEMLVEEYGERAVEARRPSGYVFRLRFPRRPVMPLEVSEDEIAEGEPPPDSAS